ncbi:MAG: peptidase MA family metallohydrolase [Oscillochloridaceae bacterium]|nr:peptidase MA family metallohydrolase [Chloroflexaceae bacterium]MDW8390272.1 peptidase MA family metallohydrolase [Oscillochloridaceae bacterium]
MKPLARHFLILALLMAGLLAPVETAGAVAGIEVVSTSARSEFPARITFNLTARAEGAEIVAAQLLYGATRQRVLTVVDVPVTPGRRIEARHVLDTEVYYYPPGTAIAYRWALRDASGAEVTTPLAEVIHHDERFPWAERTERNVTVFWYQGGAAFGEALITAATAGLDRIAAALGAELQQPVRIYIYASNADLRTALQANSVDWIGGQAFTDLGVIIGAIAPGDEAEAGRLIPHELAHQVLAQLTDNPYGGPPSWFDEGLAMYAQARRDDWIDAQLEQAAREGRLIPLEALAASFPADADQALLSYAQSQAVVEYLIATYGADRVRALALAFAAAMPVDQALQTVLGRGVDELDAEWRATLPSPEQTTVATPVPQTAPADRFTEPAASLPGAGVTSPGGPGLAGVPLWPVAVGALLCGAALLLAGVVALVRSWRSTATKRR